jgi:2-oxoglutarate ferredoxin oxidoreductase subunit gamma
VRTEIQIAGFGGQGIVLSGYILGEAAIIDGKNAVQTQSYGPESRGGAARSDVVISEEKIDYPKVLNADIFVAMSQPAFDKYIMSVGNDSTVILDKDLVNSGEGMHYRIPFTRIADDLGRKIVANSVMLGFVCALTGVVSRSSLLKSLGRNIPKKTEQLNVSAFEEGWSKGKAVRGKSNLDKSHK